MAFPRHAHPPGKSPGVASLIRQFEADRAKPSALTAAGDQGAAATASGSVNSVDSASFWAPVCSRPPDSADAPAPLSAEHADRPGLSKPKPDLDPPDTAPLGVPSELRPEAVLERGRALAAAQRHCHRNGFVGLGGQDRRSCRLVRRFANAQHDHTDENDLEGSGNDDISSLRGRIAGLDIAAAVLAAALCVLAALEMCMELLTALLLRALGRAPVPPAPHPAQRLPLRAMYETAGAASGTATGLRDGLRGFLCHWTLLYIGGVAGRGMSGDRSGPAWGGAASRLGPAPSGIREALAGEAHRSRPDISGVLRCHACGKALRDYASLAQHLRDRHRGLNHTEGPDGGQGSGQTLTLADLMSARRVAPRLRAPRGPQHVRSVAAAAAAAAGLTAQQRRGVNQLVQASQSNAALAAGFRGRLSSSGKKKMSRLKRIILRERAENSAREAAAAAEAAAEAARSERAKYAGFVAQLQVVRALASAEEAAGRQLAPQVAEQVYVLELATAQMATLAAAADARHAEAVKEAERDSDASGSDDEYDGPDEFENVLATWLRDAHTRARGAASAVLAAANSATVEQVAQLLGMSPEQLAQTVAQGPMPLQALVQAAHMAPLPAEGAGSVAGAGTELPPPWGTGAGGAMMQAAGDGALQGAAHHQGLRDAGQEGTAGGNAFGVHEYHCLICGCVCCGKANFEQHKASKRHARKAAAAAALVIGVSGGGGGGTAAERERDRNCTTYVGLNSQCRPYVKQVISTELNKASNDLLTQLHAWEDRAKQANPLQAAGKKRLASGLREVAKAVRARKARVVLVAPNIEPIAAQGGLDDQLDDILRTAKASGTPVVFCGSRKKLGQVFGCRKKMSAIAILDTSGAEHLLRTIETLAAQGCAEWHAQCAAGDSAAAPEQAPQEPAPADMLPSPQLMRVRADGRPVPLTGAALNVAMRPIAES
ncbi:hypothetical protein WJX81_007062 [Elliptochloris bilobata]|uniref:C2H2-type domain-containing protein n=1 Tax=Elliptochloris bilobata TaxID=381761 RepID=A0AAW1RBD8_9CHLO